MTKTPLDDAERRFNRISPTETNGRFAAIRQVLKDRQRPLRGADTPTALPGRVKPKDQA